MEPAVSVTCGRVVGVLPFGGDLYLHKPGESLAARKL